MYSGKTQPPEPIKFYLPNFQSNITSASEQQKNLEDVDTTSKEFLQKLMVEHHYIEHRKLAYPMTVCVSNNCTEVKKDLNGKSRVLYKQKCHSHCYLTGVVENLYPNPDLQDCWAMSRSGNQVVCHVSFIIFMNEQVE